MPVTKDNLGLKLLWGKKSGRFYFSYVFINISALIVGAEI